MMEDIESVVTAGGLSGDKKNEFPIGMRVLAVDDDQVCLKLLENLLRRCQYDGTFTLFIFKTLILFSSHRNDHRRQ